jgi:hypothetical protein
VEHLFGIRPTWVPLHYSNKGLPPWQGAAACIADETTAWIQLRTSLQRRRRLWGFYSRDELIAHELAHIGRMAYNEPRFEELLAYQTAPPFRQRWAALIQTPLEAILLLSTFLVASLVATLLLFFYPLLYAYLYWIQFLPFLLVIFLAARLTYRRHQLKRLSHLPPALVYRLTDAEIITFGNMSRPSIRKYAEKQTSLRWQMLRAAYFKG